MSEGYKRELDKSEKIDAINVGKTKGERFLNVIIYSYDNGPWKARIVPVNKNSNPNAESNKQWIQQKAISSLTVEEVESLIKSLEKVAIKLKRK